jgi:fructokinase
VETVFLFAIGGCFEFTRWVKKPFQVIGIGELLWDLLPAGPRMGGAPANFACHAHALGADAAVISRVGADGAGMKLLQGLTRLGVSTTAIGQDPDRPTGTVDVSLAGDGQPQFRIVEGVAWDEMQCRPEHLEIASRADAICFGTLGQRSETSRRTIRQIVSATPVESLRVFDVNLRQSYYDATVLHDSLELANVCKLSDAELPTLAALLGLEGDICTQLDQLVRRYSLRLVVFTRGGNGSILTDGLEWIDHPGLEVEVKDTIGAGDSFTAATTMGMLRRVSLGKISDIANRVAAFVCSQDGAVPELPEALRNAYLTE